MRKRIFAYFVPAVLMLACRSEQPTVAVAPESATAHTAPAVSMRSDTVRWPLPAGLPTFGIPSEKSIRVAVFGMTGTVRRPGYYFLSEGAVVRDAVEAARGLGDITWWRTYSGLERPKLDGSFEVIRFTRNRSAEEQIVLEDGDRLYFGHEVY